MGLTLAQLGRPVEDHGGGGDAAALEEREHEEALAVFGDDVAVARVDRARNWR